MAVTAMQYRAGEQAVEIRYATAASSFGIILVARTARGISAVILSDSESEAAACLVEEFPKAALKPIQSFEIEQELESIENFLSGRRTDLNLPLDVRATDFQRKVWSLLQTIPYGETVSYTQLAELLGQPTAARAVARACATNPAALVIPCHRVVRGDGAASGYKWGLKRKEKLLQMESSRHRAR
jgi:AraC family transcriptional regulator of adaptative response/methylated-DNA-[protein]-cysteine methyltransferase